MVKICTFGEGSWESQYYEQRKADGCLEQLQYVQQYLPMSAQQEGFRKLTFHLVHENLMDIMHITNKYIM